MVPQINVRDALLPKLSMKILLLLCALLLGGATAANAQRRPSFGVATGPFISEDAAVTAAFALTAGVRWQLPWTVVLQRSVADLEGDTVGTLRDVSLALLASVEPWRGRLLLAAGPSLYTRRREVIGENDERDIRFAVTGMAGLRLPIAGEGLSVELLARADLLESSPQFTGLFGIHVRPGARFDLSRGEPTPPRAAAQRAAVWNDVVMQLILLQQNLESFTRIKEIEAGIELEFDLTAVTLYDDVAKVSRVLAAADPPVVITVFAPNAGRAGAAVTAGSFPAERLRLQRDTRVFLRVEH
jgi:hypothetical protein